MIHGILFPLWFGYCVAERQEGICVRAKNEIEDSYRNIRQIEARYDDGWTETWFMKMVSKSTAFVDKSLLIKRIVETKEKVILINSPSRTGKTVNLSMLKDFFEIRIHKSNGTVCARNHSSSYKFFTEGKVDTTEDDALQDSYFYWTSAEEEVDNLTATYTSPPLISKHRGIIDEHLGKYPIIHLDLKIRPTPPEQTIVENLIDQICLLFKKYHYLHKMLKDEVINKNASTMRKTTARKHLSDFVFYKHICVYRHELLPIHVENSLLILSKILYEHFDQRVIILIDEFVAMRYYTFKDKECIRQHLKRNLQQLRNGTLKNFLKKTLLLNPYLEKAILTGILSVNKKDLFADITDLVHYTAIDNDLHEFYGFTDNELTMLFDHFRIPDELGQQARFFYNGYIMKPNANLVMYNMWSIVNFLNKKIVKDYWIEYTGSVKRIHHMIDIRKMRNIWQSLINADDVVIYFTDLEFDLTDLQFFTKNVFYRKDVGISDKSVNSVLTLFCHMGILTNRNRGYLNPSNKNNTYSIRIPNEEVRWGIQKRLSTS